MLNFSMILDFRHRRIACPRNSRWFRSRRFCPQQPDNPQTWNGETREDGLERQNFGDLSGRSRLCDLLEGRDSQIPRTSDSAGPGDLGIGRCGKQVLALNRVVFFFSFCLAICIPCLPLSPAYSSRNLNRKAETARLSSPWKVGS